MAKSKADKESNNVSQDRAITTAQNPDEFLIAGIGASAGGIQALQTFFSHVPEDSGIAYVVILHLSPDHDSKLTEILQITTTMKVSQVLEKVKVEPNHVYVVPPNQHLIMLDGSIVVSLNMQEADRRAPVDIFFRTLAEEHGSRAIAIILSGTGANGSMGIKRIKEKGGATFVQNPREAEFNEMPRNSIATGLIDQVLNVAELPGKIIAYKNSLGTIKIPEDAAGRPEEQQKALREIFTELRVRTGHDFSNYKPPTLLRRIERRINIHGLENLPEYAGFMKENSDETTALLKNLLISVTNFFRDKNAFQIIEKEVLPSLLKGRMPDNGLRIWVAGCATGEEAYSMAMLCADLTEDVVDAPKIQIFATDIDEAALAKGREGLYTLNDVADVSPERLRQYFNKEGDCYRIRREIRETVMFALHNFLKDPPFSHLDLISCRNVMIYLNHVAQERVTEFFHFALNPGGYLFLGSSESVDGATDLYSNYNRENHIFQSRQASHRSYPITENIPRFYFNKSNFSPAVEQESKMPERISFGDLHQQLLEQYAPPSMVINGEYDIVHVSESAGRYLQIGGGEISRSVLKLIHPSLRLELRSALYQATQRQAVVEAKAVKYSSNGHSEVINIHVRPVLRTGDLAKGFFLLLFDQNLIDQQSDVTHLAEQPIALQLEEELMRLKAQLRTSNEHHEFQAEELKASNEELQAMNEELRSAAEELETSKEELQSMNEELRTVNQELKVKVEEATLTSNNLQNLINSTDIGTIFLDKGLRVALYTPVARNIFNLIPADYGRLLGDITGKIDYPNLLQDAEAVLAQLATLEQEVRTVENKVYLMRISPYRTTEDLIKGVVISFIDITARKQAEQLLEENIKELTRFNQAMVSREIRMIELKKEVNALYKSLGEPPRYPLDANQEDHQGT